MLTREESALLTRVGPGTPGGELLRRYWQPVAMATELPEDAPPLPLRILGEDLVLFRDDRGRLGLLGVHCSHRGADLSYGRIEDGGLRCLYHGWLYSVTGECLQQPGEPAGSSFKEKVRQTAYPCQEVGGLIFAYMGPEPAPLLPDYEFLAVAEENRDINKVYSECNYLQGNEGNLDPVHTSFLHRFFREDEGPRPQGQSLVPGSQNQTTNSYFGQSVCPTIETEETDFGLRIYAIRELENGDRYVRITNYIYPNLSNNPLGLDGYTVNWHVPIDDYANWKFRISFNRNAAMDKTWLRQRFVTAVGPDGRPYRNKDNRYKQDRQEMETKSFIGMGDFFPVHDNFATESPGLIQDHTVEHLGYTDRAIGAHRRMLLRAVRKVQEGEEAPHVVRREDDRHFPDLVCLDEVIPASEDWRSYWRKYIPVGNRG